MKIQTDEDILSGSALEIMEQFRMRTFDPGEFADTETYLWFLQHSAKIFFARRWGCPSPRMPPAGGKEKAVPTWDVLFSRQSRPACQWT